MTLDELVTLYVLTCEHDYMISGAATEREVQFVEAFIPRGLRIDGAGWLFAYLRIRLRPDIWGDDTERQANAKQFEIFWAEHEKQELIT